MDRIREVQQENHTYQCGMAASLVVALGPEHALETHRLKLLSPDTAV